ncbi:hypothetical protein D0T84_02865 [Dysgonomonas sp. 521]|uniref:FISUMP domain-containing protein n=1 Tax=Dysgonomonas sp. 521 TaxID=2302932 RepID=UPI0013D3C6DE|nr:FISUMP domain-containing protein [Dysgonomonas sp. 521]NDV93860.1 hypothetical protein [Dysgonomonas sp. 521]
MKTTKTQNKPARSKHLWRQAVAFLALLLLAAGAAAQVTIGAGTPPQPFSIMEIISNQKRGLRMAHLTTDQRNSITTSAFKANAEAKGLTIYNTTTNCMEFWSGSKWISTCQGEPFSIPATEGEGTFTGKVCFDLAQGNDATGYCAPLTSRTAKKADFSLTTEQDPATQAGTTPYTGSATPYSGVQVYTFTPSADVSNVRFGYIDPSGKVVAGMEPKADYSGNNISTACKVAVTYKPTLNDDLKGRTTIYALKTDLYVVYNDAADGTGTDKYLKLDVTLSDCACCGAMAIPFTGNQSQLQWQSFMCYNLGADQKLDPFTWKSDGDDVDNDIKGYLYQWGRQSDGHEKRASPQIADILATNNQATTPVDVLGTFINTTTAPPFDWRDAGRETSRWGDGTQNAMMPKANNDPCPSGWKVPTTGQWEAIYRGGAASGTDAANVWTWDRGYKVGADFFLPAAGLKSYYDSSKQFVGINGFYWSSTIEVAQSCLLSYNNSVIYSSITAYRSFGHSVRCILE